MIYLTTTTVNLTWILLFVWILMFGSFIIGWVLSGKRSKKQTIVDSEIKHVEEESPYLEKETIVISQTQIPDAGPQIKAVQTRGRSGSVVIDENEKIYKKVKTKPEPLEDGQKLYLGNIGQATAAKKDDLKQINGIGSFIEKKLNDIGVYTFSQLSKMNDDDIEAITKLIEFFPGRIKRDQWKEQAKDLLKGSDTPKK